MPAGGQRPGFGLAVADHAEGQELGVVEHRAVGVHERVAELAALMDRSWRLGRDMAGNPAREGELAKQPPQALFIEPDMRVGLGVGAVQVDVGHQAGTAVAGTSDINGAQRARPDRPVHVDVDEVQPRGRAPVSEQARLDVLGEQRLAQQRVVEQVDLPTDMLAARHQRSMRSRSAGERTAPAGDSDTTRPRPPGTQTSTSPWASAYRTSSERDPRLSFCWMWARWVSTVRTER